MPCEQLRPEGIGKPIQGGHAQAEGTCFGSARLYKEGWPAPHPCGNCPAKRGEIERGDGGIERGRGSQCQGIVRTVPRQEGRDSGSTANGPLQEPFSLQLLVDRAS